MSLPVDEEVERNPKKRLLEVLRILASFYSFRRLEEKLGVPMQTLWKYYTLKTIPEKQTAIKILHRIKEAGLLEEAVKERALEASNPITLLENRGVLELAAYKASEVARQYGVGAVISLPDSYSAAIAFMASVYMRSKLCLTDPVYTGPDSLCTVLKTGCMARPLCISRNCLAKKNKFLLVESIYVPGSIQAVSSFLQKHRSSLVAVYILYGSQVEVEEDLRHIEEKPYTEILVVEK